MTYSSPYYRAHAERKRIVPSGVVELRVHGVNGAPPEGLLNDAHPTQIAGDELAGFYRRDRHEVPLRTVEAYSWSGLNSRPSSRAWWLLLFPYAAANFAGWLMPKSLAHWRRRAGQALIRVIGLGLTVFTMVWLCFLSLDLLAAQCAAQQSCLDHTWLGWWDWTARTVNNRVRLVVLAAAVPLLALWLLWGLGRKSGTRYDAYGTRPVPAERPKDAPNTEPLTERREPKGSPIDDLLLRDVAFWQAPDAVHIQAWVHATAAIATVTAVLAFSIRSITGSGALLWLGVAATALVAASVVAIALAGRIRQIPRRWLRRPQGERFYWPRWSWVPSGISLALLAAVGAVAWTLRTDIPAGDLTGGLEPVRTAVLDSALALVALLVLLAFVVRGWYLVAVAAFIGAAGLVTLWDTDGGHLIAWGVIVWLLAEAAAAALGCLLYRWLCRIPREDSPSARARHQLVPFLVYAGLGVVVVLAIGGFDAATHGWQRAVAVAIPLAYLPVQFDAMIRRGHDLPAKESMRHAIPYVMASLAVTTLFAFASASSIFLAQRLGAATPAPPPQASGAITAEKRLTVDITVQRPPGGVRQATIAVNAQPASLTYPAEFGYFAVGAVGGFLVFALTALLWLLMLWWSRWRGKDGDLDHQYNEDPLRDARDHYDYRFGDDERAGLDERKRKAFARRALRLRLYANMTDSVDWMLTVAVVTTAAVMTGSTIASWQGAQLTPTEAAIVGVASTLLTFLVVAAMWLVRNARTKMGLRRVLGTLWDVTAFFPRRFHPLAPPCYAERSVLELRDRIVCIRHDGGAVLAVAHSEGTLLTAAALMSLLDITDEKEEVGRLGCRPARGAELDGVAWVTYGCMLARLFGRAFPHYLRTEDLVRLKRRLGDDQPPTRDDVSPCETDTPAFPRPAPKAVPRWMNFGRYTDYLGGRVFAPLQRRPTAYDPTIEEPRPRPDDVFFRDPTRRWRYRGQADFARDWAHSFDYESDAEDPAFYEHIYAITGELASLIS